MGFPSGLDGNKSACNAGDPGSIPGLGRSPGEGNGKPLQYSGLENPMDRGAWWATVHVVTKSQTWLSKEHFHFHFMIELKLCCLPSCHEKNKLISGNTWVSRNYSSIKHIFLPNWGAQTLSVIVFCFLIFSLWKHPNHIYPPNLEKSQVKSLILWLP